MARVLFLDIDGVLNSNFWNDNHQREISDGTLVDEEKIKMLAASGENRPDNRINS